MHDSVKEGESIVQPLEASGVFPPMVISMIDVGEETGQLPEMLLKIAEVYDDEVDNAVAALTSMLEPIMIVFLALVVGTIVIALVHAAHQHHQRIAAADMSRESHETRGPACLHAHRAVDRDGDHHRAGRIGSGDAGYAQKKGARSRAEAEIAAMSAALESYKADNGVYPTNPDTDRR